MPTQEPLRLQNPAAIAQLLSRTLDSRAMLALSPLPSTSIYSSMLLEIDYASGELLLDDICPAQGQSLFKPGTELRVQAQVDGGRIEFHCPLLAVETRPDGLAYRTAIPRLMLHHERRFAYRLIIPSELNFGSTLFGETGERRRARLTDISRLGAGASLPEAFVASVGHSLPCAFELPDMRLNTAAQVRSVRRNGGEMRLGLMFSDLTPPQRHSVERAVTTIERVLLRHHVNARWV